MVAELADHGRRCSPVGQSPSEGYRLGLDAETSLIQGALYVNENPNQRNLFKGRQRNAALFNIIWCPEIRYIETLFGKCGIQPRQISNPSGTTKYINVISNHKKDVVLKWSNTNELFHRWLIAYVERARHRIPWSLFIAIGDHGRLALGRCCHNGSASACL